jgi:hypothetical protein
MIRGDNLEELVSLLQCPSLCGTIYIGTDWVRISYGYVVAQSTPYVGRRLALGGNEFWKYVPHKVYPLDCEFQQEIFSWLLEANERKYEFTKPNVRIYEIPRSSRRTQREPTKMERHEYQARQNAQAALSRRVKLASYDPRTLRLQGEPTHELELEGESKASKRARSLAEMDAIFCK